MVALEGFSGLLVSALEAIGSEAIEVDSGFLREFTPPQLPPPNLPPPVTLRPTGTAAFTAMCAFTDAPSGARPRATHFARRASAMTASSGRTPGATHSLPNRSSSTLPRETTTVVRCSVQPCPQLHTQVDLNLLQLHRLHARVFASWAVLPCLQLHLTCHALTVT
jgi:hypothetical protein